jgi:hypothetical protein
MPDPKLQDRGGGPHARSNAARQGRPACPPKVTSHFAPHPKTKALVSGARKPLQTSRNRSAGRPACPTNACPPKSN